MFFVLPPNDDFLLDDNQVVPVADIEKSQSNNRK